MNRLFKLNRISNNYKLPLLNGIIRFKSDKETHTGQKYDEDDVRNVRFIDRTKLVNKSFAIDLINESPPIPSTKRVVACNGGHYALGHPKVYINLDQPGNHACGYCGLRYYLKH